MKAQTLPAAALRAALRDGYGAATPRADALAGVVVGVIALPLSIPLTLGIGYMIGMLSFRAPLPLILSPAGLVIWLAVIIIGSIAASAYPAQQASRLTIRETLTYI